MKPHQTYVRQRSRTLQRFNQAMMRHKERYGKGPLGAETDQWEAYVAWLNERKEVLGALRDSEISRITEQQRRKANERKRERRGGGPVRGT